MKNHDPNSVSRRSVLQAGAVAAGAFAMPRELAAGERPRGGSGTKVMVVLFQRGGADSLNLYAPTSDPDYAVHRPTIGLGAPGSGAPVEGLPMDATFSMHPSMPGTHAAFTAPASNCAVVHACGYNPANRSHFASQELYETGLQGLLDGGWINRHLQATSSPNAAQVRAIQIGGALPDSLTGSVPCFAVADTADLRYPSAAASRTFHEKLARGSNLATMPPAMRLAYQSQIASFEMLERFETLDPDSYVPANGAQYPAGSLGRSLRQIAETIKADLGVEFFTVDHGGWDHHSQLVAAIDGRAAAQDEAITAFFDDLGALADDVVLVTMSEFGRIVPENGSLGTDHGMGGAMLLRGGAVAGGQVHGQWPTLAPAALVNDIFLPPLNDYRDVLLELLDAHMGGTDAAAVFPEHTPTTIGVI